MANPITWQNVNGPSLADAAAPMKYAQQMFGGAFDGLQKELDKRQLTETQNWDQGKVNNTNDFLNNVQAQDTVDGFTNQRASLQQQLAGRGAQIDQTAARAALDGRLSILQDRATKAGVYTDGQTERTQRPLRDQIMMLSRTNPAAAAALQAKHPELMNQAGLVDDQNTQVARMLGIKNAATAQAQLELMNPIERQRALQDIETKRAQANHSNASATAEGARTTLLQGQEVDRRAAAASAIRSAGAQALVKGTVFEGGVWTGKDTTDGMAILNASGSNLDSGEKNKIMSRLSEIEAAGGYRLGNTMVPLPKDLVRGILAGARDEDWTSGWNKGGVDYLNAALKKAMEATTPGGTTRDGVPIRDRSLMLDGLLALEAGQKAAIENPVPASGKGGSNGPKAQGGSKPPKAPKPEAK